MASAADSALADVAEAQASEDSVARPISAVSARVASVDAAKYLILNLTNISSTFFYSILTLL